MCLNPYIAGNAAYGCGQCIPCRVNRRRMWTSRIILESLLHGDNAFVTLTYEDDKLPEGGSLDPGELQRFFKRFRKAIHPVRVRYFAVGEYGDESFRPHYHVAMFGYPDCGNSVLSRFHDQRSCSVCGPVLRAWGNGHIQVGSLTRESAQYIAGYVMKKMTRPTDERLRGKQPEFARMSSVPGIGRDALWEAASTVMQFGVVDAVGDVPAKFATGRKSLPLGRYMRRQLRRLSGLDENAPEATLAEAQKNLQVLREHAEGVAKAAPARVRREIYKAQFAENIVEAFKGGSDRIVGRSKIRHGRKL